MLLFQFIETNSLQSRSYQLRRLCNIIRATDFKLHPPCTVSARSGTLAAEEAEKNSREEKFARERSKTPRRENEETFKKKRNLLAFESARD